MLRLIVISLAGIAGTLLPTTGRGADNYPRADLIVEPAALAKAEERDRFVILDARDRKAFDSGHVPTARWVDHSTWASAFGDGRDAVAWSDRIGALGIDSKSRVVVYDDNRSKDSARIWWILRYWGVNDARLLNGGWRGWTSGENPIDRTAAAVAPASFKAVPATDRLATKGGILESLTGGTWQIVDARSENEHCGTDAQKNKKAGAIPGAKQLEWSDLVETDSQRFKAPAEFKKLFDAAGIRLNQPTATHCQSGGRASVMAYGLELMGAKDVRNYYRSWSEWGNADDTPVVQPPAKTKRK